MPSNKNQHFVPRCHLRPFTSGPGDESINLFNLKSQRIITNAPLKHQCSKDYFYGKDEKLEKAIQFIEGRYGDAIAEIGNNPRSLADANSIIIKLFWLFQYFRTEEVASRIVQMNSQTRDIADITAEEFSINLKDAAIIGCLTFAQSMHEIDDLSFCLVKNWTKIPFVTSDNPSILTNKWMIHKNQGKEFTFGIGTAGAIVMLPLSPKLLFLGFDPDVYTVNNTNGVTEIRNDRDAMAFNQHQFLNCAANIYLQNANQWPIIISQYREIEAVRPASRFIIRIAQADYVSNEHIRYSVISPEARDKSIPSIIHSRALFPIPKIWPTTIQFRQNGCVYANGTSMGYVRQARVLQESEKTFWSERA